MVTTNYKYESDNNVTRVIQEIDYTGDGVADEIQIITRTFAKAAALR
jgi:hypothetical protein